MFKREVKSIHDILQQFLRKEGLETPLMQKRLIDAWDNVTGETVAQYTQEKFIKNQILYVKIKHDASTAYSSVKRISRGLRYYRCKDLLMIIVCYE